MKHKKTLELILWILVAAQLLFIFLMSAEDAASSSQTSGQVARVFAYIATPAFDRLEPVVQAGIVEGYQHVTRKLAHVIEYAMLAGFLTLALHRLERWRGAMLAMCAATLYAALDEWHQMTVAGRGAMFGDVLIDSAGAALGAVAALLLLMIVRKRIQRRS